MFVAQPPLFRIDVPAQGKGKPARKLYALDKQELAAIEEKLVDEGVQGGQLDGEPLQGPGRDEPGAAVGDHAQSRHAPHAAGARRGRRSTSIRDIFNMMMARENASQRREWMETYGNLVDADIS